MTQAFMDSWGMRRMETVLLPQSALAKMAGASWYMFLPLPASSHVLYDLVFGWPYMHE